MNRGPEKARDLIRERGSPAHLCVRARGRVVLNESLSCPADSQFFLFSADSRTAGARYLSEVSDAVLAAFS